MSGVLDRMVMRMRDKLPTVQPLVSSRYAQVGGSAEMLINREVSASGAEDATGRLMPMQTYGGQHTVKMPVLPLSEREPMKPIAQPSAGGKEQSVSARAFRLSSEQQPVENNGGMEKDVSASANAEHAPRADAKEEPVLESTIAGWDTVAEKRDAKTIGRTGTEKPGPEMKSATTVGRRADAHTGPLVTPVEQRTEIQITIGSIELRAPQPVPTPRPAAFRPRVTLDEFLSRKPGTKG